MPGAGVAGVDDRRACAPFVPRLRECERTNWRLVRLELLVPGGKESTYLRNERARMHT
jgi:hypothetical protein